MPNFEIISWEETTNYPEQYSHNYLHLHQAYEILLLLSGEADVQYYDRNHEITHSYHATPGDLLLFSSLEIHQIKITKFPYRRLGVRFSINVLQRLFHNLALTTIYSHHDKHFCHQIQLRGSNLNFLRSILTSIHNEYLHQFPFFQETMEYWIGQFTVSLYRISPSSFPNVGISNLHTLEEIQQYIQQYFKKPIHINDVAQKFYLSQSYLSRAFKDYTGMSPKQYLNLCRIAYTRELLIKTTLPLEAIAESSGIADANSLIRLFRKMIGVTPGTYRKAMQKDLSFTQGAPLPPNSVAELAIGTQIVKNQIL